MDRRPVTGSRYTTLFKLRQLCSRSKVYEFKKNESVDHCADGDAGLKDKVTLSCQWRLVEVTAGRRRSAFVFTTTATTAGGTWSTVNLSVDRCQSGRVPTSSSKTEKFLPCNDDIDHNTMWSAVVVSLEYRLYLCSLLANSTYSCPDSADGRLGVQEWAGRDHWMGVLAPTP